MLPRAPPHFLLRGPGEKFGNIRNYYDGIRPALLSAEEEQKIVPHTYDLSGRHFQELLGAIRRRTEPIWSRHHVFWRDVYCIYLFLQKKQRSHLLIFRGE